MNYNFFLCVFFYLHYFDNIRNTNWYIPEESHNTPAFRISNEFSSRGHGKFDKQFREIIYLLHRDLALNYLHFLGGNVSANKKRKRRKYLHG